MSIPVISVVIPVFNRETEIGNCLKSLLQQDFHDFEAVVVNDCSTDGTATVVASIGDPRIRLINLPENRGHAAAGNVGILAAVSSLICFLDSDDEFLPCKLSFIHQFFLNNSEVDVLVDSFEFLNQTHHGNKRKLHRNPELRCSRDIEDAVYRRRLYKATGAISAKREALIKAGLWDVSLRRRTDMDLILRLAQTSRCMSTSTVLWRKYGNSNAISSHRETFIAAVIDIVQRHPKYTSRFRWRLGLAKDIASHMLALLLYPKFGLALNDWKQLVRFFGPLSTIYYLVLGSLMLFFQTLRYGKPV